MQIIKIFSIILLCIYVLLLLYFCKKSENFFKTMLISVLSGVLTMAVVNIAAKYTGVNLPVNLYTVGSSCIFGLPGVLGLLLIRIIF